MTDQQPASTRAKVSASTRSSRDATRDSVQPTVPAEALTKLVPAGSMRSLVRDIVHVMAKACLSSIPLAALGFDIGDKLVAFASKKQMSDFLHRLAEEVEKLNASVSDLEDLLTHSALFRSTAEHGMILIATGETDEDFLAALRNAALNLGMEDPKNLVAQEIARLIRVMTPLQLRMLSLYDRYWSDNLTIEEKVVVAAEPGINDNQHEFRLGALAKFSIPYPYLDRTVRELRSLELLSPGFSGGVYSGGTDTSLYLDKASVGPLGKEVLRAVSVPFGKS